MHLEQFLKNREVWFEVIKHRPTFTAQTTARALHIAADEVAKTILLRADGHDVLAVVPAGASADLSAIKKLLKTDDVTLVYESDLLAKFPDCEEGCLPPFGSQYGMQTVLDESLSNEPEIVVEGNTHAEAIRIRYQDYVKLERPLVANIVQHLEV